MREEKTFKHWFVPELTIVPGGAVRGMAVRETMRAGPPVHRPQGTQDWLLMAFHGAVDVRTATGMHHHPNGTLVVWSPGQGHDYGNRHTSYDHSWIHMRGEWVARLITACRVSSNTPLTCPADRVAEHVDALFLELTHPHPDGTIARNLLENMLRDIARHAVSPTPPRSDDEPWRHLLNYIQSHLHEHLTVPSMAAQLHLSTSHFASEFRRRFGVAPMTYVISIRMREAMHLLSDPHMPIKAIAARVGYDDPYYFSRLFTRQLGTPPSTLRRESATTPQRQ
ncbi:MAG: helix-turn-helix transcriptional regulator [Lentisphaerae bacterium]|nr:helix-turn-helix transcriptional regulator [Lentisphaerota bacterium]